MSGREVASELATMTANLEQKTGRSMTAWIEVVLASGKAKHGEMISYLKEQHGFSHGYANLVVHAAREKAAGGPIADDDLVAAQYVGKEGLRPIYESLIKAVIKFGNDVELAPKKAGVSLRRSKQFALIEPTTKTRIDIGINVKGMAPTDRLKAAGGMCTHKVGVTGLDQVDAELIGWLREAYERA
ncbi:MAG TPA: DUF4287 domain-containing protein [Acidimicrobiia bacterium]|nr:DUF4287 domain-containing protein [Acidimicrobiia bacterium]